jgi:hypothetical protein
VNLVLAVDSCFDLAVPNKRHNQSLQFRKANAERLRHLLKSDRSEWLEIEHKRAVANQSMKLRDVAREVEV